MTNPERKGREHESSTHWLGDGYAWTWGRVVEPTPGFEPGTFSLPSNCFPGEAVPEIR